MQKELELRQELSYPPFCRMLRFLISDENEEKTERAAFELGEALAANLEGSGVEMVGPAPCPLEKLQNRYRWHILLKASSLQDLQTVVRKALPNHDSQRVRVALDPDPLELL